MSANDERKKMETGLNSYRANKETFEECMKNVAEMYFMRFQFLIASGFTEQQAFEIVKERGLE